jgi:transposase
MVLPQGLAKFRTAVVRQLEAEQATLTPLSTEVFWHLNEEFLALEQQVAYSHAKLQALARAHPVWQRVQAIPGLGPLTATAALAAVPDATHVNNGRPWAAWLGLVPREHSTGGKPRRLGMSTRGDVYRRTLLVHGARATLRWVDTTQDDRHRWLKALSARRGKHRAAVA